MIHQGSVFKAFAKPSSPWSAKCSCGSYTTHTTELTAHRAMLKHLNHHVDLDGSAA